MNKKISKKEPGIKSIRLDKFLSNAHIGTRNEVKKIIKEGRVSVNFEIISYPDYHVKLDDIIEVDGKRVEPHKNVYIIFHKPSGFVSTTSDREQSVLNLIDHPYLNELHIAGRLDKDVEGLLILTNDGEFTHNLISPKKHIEKEYWIYTKENIEVTQDMVKMVSKGIEIEKGTKTLPGKIRKVSEKIISLTIIEGKYHQIKKMCISLGIEWEKIVRVRIGKLTFEGLEKGKWKELSKEEISKLVFG